MPRASSLRSCSASALNTERSPDWSRATSCPAMCAATNSASISSSASGAVSTMRASSGQYGQKLARHDRAGIEADGTARDEIAAAQRDEVWSARPRADEMHRHGASVSASAQVTGPTEIRGRMSLAFGPPAARAAASATEGTPTSAFTRGDEDCARLPAASRSLGATRTSGTPRARAARDDPRLAGLSVRGGDESESLPAPVWLGVSASSDGGLDLGL